MDQPIYRTLIPLFDELRGPRVVVRPYRPDDAQALFDAVAESREYIRPWLPFADAHQSVAESRDWLIQQQAKWLLREDLALSIWDAADPARFLGGVGLHPHNWDIRFFEIGYWLRPSAAGQGYMTAAVQLLVDYALGELGAQRLQIRCDERNAPSAAVARRVGFVLEGRLRNDSRGADGSLRTTLFFGRVPGDPP
ncbi:MAG TPA: GNAT family N-acetyltransferase [Chloroflexia bacterium]|nr:GNAT family N-acetyltransferase [Chloroflexia bacterium]